MSVGQFCRNCLQALAVLPQAFHWRVADCEAQASALHMTFPLHYLVYMEYKINLHTMKDCNEWCTLDNTFVIFSRMLLKPHNSGHRRSVTRFRSVAHCRYITHCRCTNNYASHYKLTNLVPNWGITQHRNILITHALSLGRSLWVVPLSGSLLV